MEEWELYSEIDEKGRFPKKIKKEKEEKQKQFEKEYEEIYWKEVEREAKEFLESGVKSEFLKGVQGNLGLSDLEFENSLKG